MTETEISDGHVRALSKALKQAYINEKTQRIGNKRPYKFSPKHDKDAHWKKIAVQCLELNADPITYMRAAFIKCTMPDGPFVNSLGGAAAEAWYRNYVRTIGSKADDIRQPNETIVDAVERKELSTHIKEIRATLEKVNGTWEPNEKNVEWLLRYSNPVPVHIRALLCYPVEETRIRYGKEAHDYFAARPQLINAAKKLGFPMYDILIWLNQIPRNS